MSEREQALEVLQIKLWSQASPQIAASVMGMGLAEVLARTGTVTWCASPSRIVLTGGNRETLLSAISGVATQMRGLSKELSAGRITIDSLAARFSLYASHAGSIAAQIECQETVTWQASLQARRAGGWA